MKNFNINKSAIGIILAILMLSTVVLVQPALACPPPNPQDISVQQAKHIIGHTDGVIILDVRNQTEYELGHLFNAEIIPLYALENKTVPFNLPEPASNDTVMVDLYQRITSSFNLSAHINDPIVVYCQAGSRSASACQILASHGFTQVYNVIGGITAWMQAGYPIYTTYHHASVEVLDEKITVDIQPWLLYTSNCSSCQSQQCSTTADSLTNSTETVIEDTGNHTLVEITGEHNGQFIDFTVEKTLLWSYNESIDNCNRTMTLLSMIVTNGNNTAYTYGLRDIVQHPDYNFSINTVLYPLDSQSYKNSTTTVDYQPIEGKEITTSEKVDFNTSATLSQLYTSLGKVANKLSNEYLRSEDGNLTVFGERYATITDETKNLAQIVNTQIPEYNLPILNSTAAIIDASDCDNCFVLCPLILAIGLGVCWALCIWAMPAACSFCLKYLEAYTEMSAVCSALCYAMCYVWTQSDAEGYWFDSYYYIENYQGGYVDDPNNILLSYKDANYAHFWCPNSPDMTRMFGNLNAQTSGGDVYLYAYTGSGYVSDMYVYTSNDGSSWNYCGYNRLTNNSPASIHFGSTGAARYILVIGNNGGFSVSAFVDAVAIVP